LQDVSIHKSAEQGLARRITEWREKTANGRVTLVGHSAGCGGILGALGRLNDGIAVADVILLAPSVSPGYGLAPALRHLEGEIQVFHSERDTFWLQWRTSTFGTYDNIRTPAAGHAGFALDTLPPTSRERVLQYPYRTEWQNLGNDGGHNGALAKDFVSQVIAP